MTSRKAGLPEDQPLPAALTALYRQYEAENDPYVSPVLRVSLDISRMLREGELKLPDLHQAIRHLTLDAVKNRAGRLAAYLGTCAEDDNIRTLDGLFRALAQKDGKLLPFADFQRKVDHLFYGFVFTAHPTFMMSPELAGALSGHTVRLAGAQDRDDKDALTKAIDVPFSAPDINSETAQSLQAIDNLHAAFAVMFHTLFATAFALYPQEWTTLRPRLSSIATWVGFDMDGRKDIKWATTLEKRIGLQIRQLQSYQNSLESLCAQHPGETKALQPALTAVVRTLENMQGHYGFFSGYNQSADNNLAALQAESKKLIKSAETRLLDTKPLIAAAEQCLRDGETPELQHKILVLIAQLTAFGLSRAEVHFRINSNQVHNATSSYVTLTTHPDHPSQRRSYIDEMAKLLAAVKPANIDFGDIAAEEMTARYEFMLIRQIVKYVDRESPVRFLIAETESAFTLLGALYYAKKFGVDKHVDICPLFETGPALQDSSRYMQTLLNNPQFREYIQHRGRLCIQTGYSDAGRYIGQPSAGASIERLKERFAGLLEEQNMAGTALLFFDTHGESIGRGGHPESFGQRLRYVASPYFLHKMASGKTPYTQESSYQGGDGFLPFLHKSTALAVLTRVFEYMLQDHAQPVTDPYYDEPARSEVTRFFTAATSFQSSLTGNPHYGELLGAFATNMMYRSGSRAVKRARDSENGSERLGVSQIRAIPHNAILAQFGLLANTVSGLGRACREHADFAAGLDEASARFHAILSMADRALSLSDPQIMKAYISTLDPTFWIAQARHCADPALSNKLASIATSLEQHDFHDGMLAIYRKLDWDHTLLRRFRDPAQDSAAQNILCLHAIRLALLREAFILAAGIPRFSPGHPVTREQLIRTVFHMDIERAAEALEEIFPARAAQKQAYDFGETSEYRQQEKPEGYTNIRANIITPLQHIHDMTCRISAAVAHYIGFFG